jgi:hypothetical protein
MTPRYRDVPRCPKCGGPSVLSQNAIRGDERKPNELACLACGDQWAGTEVERIQAARADNAWEKRQDVEARAAHRNQIDALRRQREEQKLAKLREGRW